MNHNDAVRNYGRCGCPCHRGSRECDCRGRPATHVERKQQGLR